MIRKGRTITDSTGAVADENYWIYRVGKGATAPQK